MATYKQAIRWIVHNDDISQIEDGITVTAALIADLFKKDDQKVIKDILNYDRKLKYENVHNKRSD